MLEDKFLGFSYSHNYLTMIKFFELETTKSMNWAEINEYLKDMSVLEIGSAGGVLREYLEYVLTSDIRDSDGVMEIQDAQRLDIADASVDLLLATNALHHLPNVEKHFYELERVLKKDGKAIYLEPNWNKISKFVFKFLHPEDWSTDAELWEFESSNPMDGNQALARNIFIRDRARFESLFPTLNIEISQKPVNGLSYLLSGGVNQRTKISATILVFMAKLESRSNVWMRIFGFNRIILLTKK